VKPLTSNSDRRAVAHWRKAVPRAKGLYGVKSCLLHHGLLTIRLTVA
jgi:hypothetical protein